MAISIHAPPRGATGMKVFMKESLRISIHAPPRGATPLATVRPLPCRFQFTPLREGRLKGVINGHAKEHFNSRPSARGDADEKCGNRTEEVFQFTPLREGRHCWISSDFVFFGHFNSRPSARGDGKRYAISANLLFNPYKSAWLNNSATQFVEIILVIFHRIIA